MALYSEEYGYQSGCVEDGTFVSVIPGNLKNDKGKWAGHRRSAHFIAL